MEAYPHLRIERELPSPERPRPRRYPRISPPSDIPAHGRALQDSLKRAQKPENESIGGFDDRLLFKLDVGTFSPEQIQQGFPGIEVLSQEDGHYAIVFANEEALEEFERRLSTLIEGGKPKYERILYALKSVDNWTPEDRKGWALKLYGLPETDSFRLDIELWPLGRNDERQKLLASFTDWLNQQGALVLDGIAKADLIAYRVMLSGDTAKQVLRHRDVRMADLPPRMGLELEVLQTDIQDIPNVPAPPQNAPLVAVLDSGIASGHPLLAPAVGDAQGFICPDRSAADDDGHGTLVAGIALYDDVEECASAKSFIPQLRLLSGRILDQHAEADPRFIENIIEDAVRYFHSSYGCKIYNLSYGDLNKPYQGGRVRGLAYTLDCLSRELGVLFVVPTGNLVDLSSLLEAEKYPHYLFKEKASLLDPAPALNVLTVGSIARWDRSVNSWRHPDHIEDTPLAQRDFPSPFTRCGPSVRDAIKPELAAYGGNLALKRDGRQEHRWLGELSTSKDFSAGRLLAEDYGTSFSAPHIAHLAARLLTELPDATPNLLRALLVANASVPSPTVDLLSDKMLQARAVGYGLVDTANLYRSTEENVSLVSEAALINNYSHFYEVPLPDSIFGGRRNREITVALAHTPPVRTTRLDYKASRLQFKLVKGDSLEDVANAFDRAKIDDVHAIKEYGVSNRSCYTEEMRGRGTVQASTWTLKDPRRNRLFVVVTRNDQPWGDGLALENESYALVIRISDRENADARLYSEIRVQLQGREQARARARV